MYENKAKRALRAGQPVLAVSLAFVNAGIAEYLTRLGFDCLMLDGEHNAITDHDVQDIVRACEPMGASVLVHMPYDDARIQRYMAIGVNGLHVATIRSGAEARQVVDTVKFHPQGKRGLGSYRATAFGLTTGDWPAYMAKANEETFISVSVEEAEGLAAAPEFAKIPEIDVIQVATSDLSAALGVPGQTQHAKVLEANARIVELARGSGKASGTAIGSPAEMKAAYDRGSRFMIVSLAKMIRSGTDGFLKIYQELRGTAG